MVKYSTIEEAEAAGFDFLHATDKSRYEVQKEGVTVGYAHYSLLPENTADFDSTQVDPSIRGAGLAHLLVSFAMQDKQFQGKNLRASCWYVAQFLDRNPDELPEGANFN